MSLAATAPPSASSLSAPREETVKQPVFVKIGLMLILFWAVSQLIAVLDTLPLPVQKVLMPLKAFVGPAVLLCIAIGGGLRIRILEPLRLFVVFSSLAVLNLLIRLEPNWIQAAIYVAWCGCFVIAPQLLCTRARLIVLARWSLRALTAAIAFTIVMGLLSGDYTYSQGGRMRYEFGTRNANYLAGFVACLIYMALAVQCLSLIHI